MDSVEEKAILADARATLEKLVVDDPESLELLARFDRWAPDLWEGLAPVYDAEVVLSRVVELIAAAHAKRSPALRARDRARVLQPDWFQLPDAVGYVAYADRFAGNLEGVRKRIDYLSELGITYLHLMPLLKPRPGPNDGGYAVADYRAVREDLGTIEDLAKLTASLHEAGISLTLDLVLNHVAKEHAWAEAARNGDAKHRDYFYVYPDRQIPDEFERSLPEIFPAFAPGNFTWDEQLQGWVWTTFNEWQWDVNWSNPDVLCEFIDIILHLANLGVDCLRLDAIAFIWKRMGTNSQNQPEVHAITQVLRSAARIAAPATIFKAEAIVAPDDLVAYLGQGKHTGKVSDLAYHNSLMVQIWSAMATRDGRLLAAAMNRFPEIPTTTAWGTYLRCHDDIGWAIDDVDAGAVGWDGWGHRKFLSDFFAGEFEGTFARGAVFQPNEATGDRRISGSAASLIGVEAALERKDRNALDQALARLNCAYAMVFGFGGIPLLYMGDELGLLNDYAFTRKPEHADDNRWLHRPEMPWDRLGEPLAELVSASIRSIIAARKRNAGLHASMPTRVVVPEDPSVVLFIRQHPAGPMVQAYNLSDRERTIPLRHLYENGIHNPLDDLSGRRPNLIRGEVRLAPYAANWFVESRQ